MFKIINYCIIILLLVSACQDSTEAQSANIAEPKNELYKESAEYFLIFDKYINSFVVSDRDIDEFYESRKKSVITHFPGILRNYDLTLYSQFSIACYLHLEGQTQFLDKLWNEHKRLSKNKEFKPILELLKHFKISKMD